MRKIDIHRKIGFIHFAIEGGYMKRTLNLILSKTCQINKFLSLRAENILKEQTEMDGRAHRLIRCLRLPLRRSGKCRVRVGI